jgi:hypothetical protein
MWVNGAAEWLRSEPRSANSLVMCSTPVLPFFVYCGFGIAEGVKHTIENFAIGTFSGIITGDNRYSPHLNRDLLYLTYISYLKNHKNLKSYKKYTPHQRMDDINYRHLSMTALAKIGKNFYR